MVIHLHVLVRSHIFTLFNHSHQIEIVDRNQFPWGIGSQDNPLDIFVSVAANDTLLPFGKKIYVPQLDGIQLPNNNICNGCLRVDDTGFSFGDNQIDFFVGRMTYFEDIVTQYPQLNNSIQIYAGDCELKTYNVPII